jgi:hypothetical protein
MARSIALGLALGGLVACRPSTRDFLETIKPQVVALLCDRDRPPDQLPIYYRKCFEVDEVQCIAAMQREVDACVARLVQGSLDESNAGNLAERVGACAGTEYEIELERQGKRIRSDACDTARDTYAKARASVGQP